MSDEPQAPKPDPPLGRYKSAESKARGEANLVKGQAQPGDVRRNNFTKYLDSQQDIENALLSPDKFGEPSDQERWEARFQSQLQVALNHPAAWLGVNPNNQSAQALKRVDTVTRLGKTVADSHERLLKAREDRLARERTPNNGQMVTPRTDRETMLRVAMVLLKSGALLGPNTSKQTRRSLSDFFAGMERGQLDAAARHQELADLPTTTGGNS